VSECVCVLQHIMTLSSEGQVLVVCLSVALMVAVFAITLYMCRKVTLAPPSHHHPTIMPMALSRCPTITHTPCPSTHAQPLNRPKQKKVVSLLPIYVTVTVLLACSSPSRLLPHTSQPSPTCTAPAPRVYGSFVPICCCGPPLGSLNVCTLLEMRRDSAIVVCVCARARVYGGWVMTVGTLGTSVLRALGHPYGNARGRCMMS
jgi:hypothetical protein